jgi:hypothetical protein
MPRLCAALSRPLTAGTYNGGMNKCIENGALEEGHGTRGSGSMPNRSSSVQATGDQWSMSPKEVNTMAKKDEGTRDIKKGKERER